MGGKSSTISTSEQRILSLQVQQSSYGLTLPVVFGQNRLAGNLIDYTDFTAIATTTRTRSGGKGGGGKVTQEDTKYTYEAAVIMGLCHGQIAGVVSYWRDKDRHFDLSELSLTLMSGSHTQAPWAYMQGKHPERAITYADTAYLCSPNYSLGSNAQVPNHSFEVAGLRQIGSGNPDAAADQVLQDMLTNADWAAAFPAQRLAPLDDYRNYTRANGLFLSPVLQEQQEAREHISLLLEQTNSAPVWSNDQLKIIPYGDEAVSGNGASYTPNLTPVYDLTVDDFLADEGEPPLQIERISQADRKNRVVVEYLDRANAYNIATASAQDQTSIARDGYRPMEPLRMHGICRGDVAQKVAQLRLQRSLYIANEYEFRLGWKYALLEPMDVVTLTEPGLGLNRLPVRITRIEEDVAGTLTVAAEDFPAGVGTAKVAPGQPSLGSSTNFNAAPGSAYAPVIFEAPLQITNNEPQLWLATAGGPDWGGCSVWISLDGDSYRKIGQMAGKSRYGSTTAALALGPAIDSAQLLRVDISASGGQLLGGTQADAQAMVTACYVDGEYISYATATLTGSGRYDLGYLVRGGYGSSNAAHAAGSQFVRLTDPLFKGALPADWLGKTIRVKLTSFNVFGGAEQSLADVPAYSYTVVGAPMGAVQNLRIMSMWSLGRDAKIGWDVLPGADSYDVEVLNGSTRVRLVQGVVDNMYTYTPQDQRADGGPWRNLVIRVRGRAVTGKTGAWSQIVASNPQAAAPVAVDLKPGIKSAFLTATPPADDDIAGLIAWLSTDPACPAVAANLVYDGIPALVTLPALKNGTALSGATDYYVRCAFYDTFGKDALNTSTPVKFRPWEVSQIAKDLDVMNLSAAMQQEIAKGQTALDGVADLTDVIETTIDLTGQDQSTYYPVMLQLGGDRHTFRVTAKWGASTPNWSTHGVKAFWMQLSWSVSGSGWGARLPDRVVHDYQRTFVQFDPVTEIGQLTNYSWEYVKLRGGAKYVIQHHKSITPALVTAATSYGGQAIAPGPFNAGTVPVAENTRLKQLSASITTVQTAITDLENNKASAQSVQTLESTVGTHTSQIQTTQEVVDGVSALTMFRQSVGGRVAGMGIASELINGKPATAVAFETDALKIYMPGKGDMPLVAADTRNSGVFGINGNLIVNGAGIFNSVAANSVDMAFAKAGTLNVNTLTSGTGGGNLQPNAAFVETYTDTVGRKQPANVMASSLTGTSWTGVDYRAAYVPRDTHLHALHRPNDKSNAANWVRFETFPVVPGEYYEYSSWGGCSAGNTGYLVMLWLLNDGTTFTQAGHPVTYFPVTSWKSGMQLSDYSRIFRVVQAPANAIAACLQMGLAATTATTGTHSVMMLQPYVGIATGPNQSQPSPWSPSGFGTQIHGGAIKANTVAADALSVTQLSAISANMGSITGGSMNIGSGKFIVNSSGDVTANSITMPGMTAKNGVLTVSQLNVIDVENTNITARLPHFRVFVDRVNNSHTSPVGFPRTHQLSYSSMGSVLCVFGQGGGDVGSLLFELRVTVKSARTIQQHIHIADNNLYVYVDGVKVADLVGPVPNASISFSLPAGTRTIHYVVRNTLWQQIGLLSTGEIIDNNNIKFAGW